MKPAICLYCKETFTPKDARRNKFCRPEHYNLWRVERSSSTSEIAQPKIQFSNFEEAWKFFSKEIGRVNREISYPKSKSRKTKKFVLVSDIQCPFQRDDVLSEMCARESDADVLIINGDFTDSYSLSNYVKTTNIPWQEEWAVATALMEKFASTFPKVWLLKGNHDIRIEKRLYERFSLDMVEAIKTMTGGTLCPLDVLAAKFKNVEIINHTMSNSTVLDWAHQFGDVILMHAEKYSVMPGAVMRKISEWLSDFEIAYEFSSDYKVIFQSHTHAYVFMPYRAGEILIETGCACKTMPYQTTARIGARPQRACYITFEQTDGVTDINSIRTRFFD
jgi:predicted phosphodiesterase